MSNDDSTVHVIYDAMEPLIAVIKRLEDSKRHGAFNLAAFIFILQYLLISGFSLEAAKEEAVTVSDVLADRLFVVFISCDDPEGENKP